MPVSISSSYSVDQTCIDCYRHATRYSTAHAECNMNDIDIDCNFINLLEKLSGLTKKKLIQICSFIARTKTPKLMHYASGR